MKMLCRIMMVLGLGMTLLAQAPKGAAAPPAKKEASEAQEPKAQLLDGVYKLSFTISEFEDGKRLNQRDYSMIGKANSSPPASLKVGTRVPVPTDDSKMRFQYMDVGVEIRCSLKEPPMEKLQANCDFNISSVVMPESFFPAIALRETNIIRVMPTSLRIALASRRAEYRNLAGIVL